MSSKTVRVVNTSDEPFTHRWDGTSYTVPAGGEAFVPFAAACLWLGDPRAKNLSPTRRHRLDEYKRLMAKWGVLDNSPETLQANRPPLKVFTTEGAAVPMVIDDPEGPGLDPFAAPGDRSAVDTEERVYRLEEALSQLAASGDSSALASTLADLGIGDVTGPASTVGPKKARASKQAAPPVDAPGRPKVDA